MTDFFKFWIKTEEQIHTLQIKVAKLEEEKKILEKKVEEIRENKVDNYDSEKFGGD